MRETILATLITIGLVLLVVLFVLWGLNLAGKISCTQTANQMGFSYEYSLITGCMIQVEDQWIPIGNYRIVE